MALRLIAAAGATGVAPCSCPPTPWAWRLACARPRQATSRVPPAGRSRFRRAGRDHRHGRGHPRAGRRHGRRGAGVIVLLGGDGTVRAASATSGDVALLPLSTGTNNAFPEMWEATVAGTAAGLLATGRAARRRQLPGQGAPRRGRAGRGDRARRRLRLDRGPRRLEGAVAARHPARGLLRVRRAARHRPVEHRRAAAPGRPHRPRRRRRAARPAPARAADRARPDRPGRGRADRDPRRRPAAGAGQPHGRGRARHRRRRRRARGRVLARHPRHRHARADGPHVLDVRRVLAAAARERLLVSQIQEVT